MNKREQWRAVCKQELGKPYVWGARGPDAYDGAGFAQWALKHLNLDPPGDQTAAGLYRFFLKTRSELVSSEQADLGDLVFYGTEEAVTHVGLAWGDGTVLEAGGGGRTTTSVAAAQARDAKVRIRPIGQREDLVAILRPLDFTWLPSAFAETPEAALDFGHYDDDTPVLEWLGDGRSMRLLHPFAYIEASGREWPVPTYTVVDGASIPQVFWSLIGSPFVGLYRNASIVHDHYCDARSRPWQRTHRMFYDAMRCSGVAVLQAKIMYYAVYRFGPRWTIGPVAHAEGFMATAESATAAAPLPTEPFDTVSFETDAALIRTAALDLAAIEALADARGAGNTVAPPYRTESDTEAAGPKGPFERIALEAHAAWARRPLIEQLVALQDDAVTLTTAEGVATLLTDYAQYANEAPATEVLDAPPSPPPSLEQLKPGYESLYASCKIRPERASEVAWYCKKLLQYRPRYEGVSTRTAVPWWFIAIVHALEASFNFNSHLHNGDPLAARTVHVPKGRPPVWSPPNDWESSATDALEYEKLVGLADWSLAAALYRWESFNGFGYYAYDIHSPYLWSFSEHYSKGKFVADGKFDPEAVSKQCGAAVMLRALQEAGVVDIG